MGMSHQLAQGDGEMKETIGTRVKWARDNIAGCTQGDLARAAGMSQSNLALIESGKRQPRCSTLVRIARASGADPVWLQHGIGRPSGAEAYAHVELFGHINLHACRVREIDDLGGKALEATELNGDGSDGKVHILNPAAIYRRTLCTKDEALKDAAERYRDDMPPSPCTELVRPVPWQAIGAVLHYIGDMPTENPLSRDVAVLGKWYEDEQNDIPF